MKFWQVDAFTNTPFKGNPAAVFILDNPLADDIMQNIAIEMNLSETAFILIREGQNPLLRWFTPAYEVDLCGHATLASAHIYMKDYDGDCTSISFDTLRAGTLKVTKQDAGYVMDFPQRGGDAVALADIPKNVIAALGGAEPIAAVKARDLMLVYADADDVRNMSPDFSALKAYPDPIIVTAEGPDDDVDCISRFFIPNHGIDEDPVTGSAHCTIAPYWAKILGKNELKAYQASKRGGHLGLQLNGQRLNISGQAVTILHGALSENIIRS